MALSLHGNRAWSIEVISSGGGPLHFAGQHRICADPATVWAALHDADVLRVCVPGCRMLDLTSSGRFEVAAEVSFGPVGFMVDGHVEIVGGEEPSLLCLAGRGRRAGFIEIEGTARIALSHCAIGCRVDYEIEAIPTGPIAIFARPMLATLARYQIEQFTQTFKARVGKPPAAVRPPAELAVDRPPPMP